MLHEKALAQSISAGPEYSTTASSGPDVNDDAAFWREEARRLQGELDKQKVLFEETVQGLTSEIHMRDAELTELEHRVREAENELRETASKMKKLEEEKDEATAAAVSHAAHAKDLQAQVERVETDANQLCKALNSLESRWKESLSSAAQNFLSSRSPQPMSVLPSTWDKYSDFAKQETSTQVPRPLPLKARKFSNGNLMATLLGVRASTRNLMVTAEAEATGPDMQATTGATAGAGGAADGAAAFSASKATATAAAEVAAYSEVAEVAATAQVAAYMKAYAKVATAVAEAAEVC